ncbi:MAG: 4-alpha-glucanotransferase [Deferribacteres bacterium]|nr:4-alpha-glucanotransferase [Deferribacteres bacterium]
MGIPVLFGIHCHQPVDNFSKVVDEIIEKSYRPFFEKVLPFKWFKFSVHFSGWLLDYIRVNSADTFKMMKKLADENRIEFFTGGYYEPVLSSIPSKDRIGQILKLSKFIENYFGQKPKGLWLTERVWDAAIVPDVAECGVEYLIVDDYHFTSIGFFKDSLYGYFNTEQDGVLMKVFPIDQKLRYLVPFKEPEIISGYLDEIERKGGLCGCLFDDGEKFGVWPKTYKWVYEDGWFERFFKLFEKSEHNFELFSHFVKNIKPNGFAYLPVTSYMEMGEWSLFADKFIELKSLEKFIKSTEYKESAETFIKGSIWKNFFIKYPESNYIHKRMLHVSKMNDFQDEHLTDLIYRAQCNDVFWHGIFGGIYLPNLRDNAYRYIIEAESILDRKLNLLNKVYEQDILMDGFKQVIINTEKIKYVYNPAVGAGLVFLDVKKYGLNLLNTMSRRFEGYHKQLISSDEIKNQEDTGISTIHEIDINLTEEMKSKIAFDWYNRQSFIDHFLDDWDFSKIKRCEFKEIGDFVNKTFKSEIFDDCVVFRRSGGIYREGVKYDTSLGKKFIRDEDNIIFEYEIRSEAEHLFFMLEFNFHFFDNENVFPEGLKGEGLLEAKRVYKILSGDSKLGIEINFQDKLPEKAAFYRVETVSQSESGADLTLQGVSLNFIFKFDKNLKFKGIFKVLGV